MFDKWILKIKKALGLIFIRDEVDSISHEMIGLKCDIKDIKSKVDNDEVIQMVRLLINTSNQLKSSVDIALKEISKREQDIQEHTKILEKIDKSIKSLEKKVDKPVEKIIEKVVEVPAKKLDNRIIESTVILDENDK